MKKTLVVIFLILCVLLVSETAFAKGKSEEDVKVVMGSSSLGGTWYSCACKIGAVAEQYGGLNITVQATGGGAENIRLMAQDEAMALSNVFIEAQKSSSMLEGTAKSKAAEIEFQTKKLAENIVAEANVEAEQIIFEAERTAAEKIAEAQSKAEQMEVASNNLRASLLDNVNSLKRHMGLVRDSLEGFRKDGISRLIEADECLNKTEATLKEGGVPVFRQPEGFEPEIPERPMLLSEKIKNEDDKRKQQEELDKLKQMAESISGKKDDSRKDDEKDDKKEESSGGQQKSSDKNDGGEKKGKIDLAALAAKANSIGKK